MGKKAKQSLVWAKTPDQRIKKRYNGEYYGRFTRRGIRIEQRLHETSFSNALLAVEKIEKMLRDGASLEDIKKHFNKSITEMPKDASVIGDYWPLFFKYRKEGDAKIKLMPWRQKTAKEYDSFWHRSFEPFWAYRLPGDINEPNWKLFIEFERKRSALGKELGFEHHIKYFKPFCGWLVEQGHLAKVPSLWDPNWSTEDDEEESHVVFDPGQITKMLRWSSDAFNLYIRLGALLGMRSSEITQLHKSRIDIAKQQIKLKAKDVKTGSKTGKGRTIPIHERARLALEGQMRAHPLSEYLFPNRADKSRPMDPGGFKKNWAEMCADLGITEGTFHSLRHTYATRVFADPNINPVLACKALGMSMATAERVYIHFTDDQLQLVARRFDYAK